MDYLVINSVEIWHGLTEAESYVMMLGNDELNRCIPVVVGPQEAQAVVVVQDKIEHQRPTTYETYINSLHAFDVEIASVCINRLVDGIFYSTIDLNDGIEARSVDSRTSDAIVLALLEGCPMKVARQIFDDAGCDSDALLRNLPGAKQNLDVLPIDELQRRLDDAVANEDFDTAALLQEMIEIRLAADDPDIDL